MASSWGSGVLLVFEDLKPGARLRGLAPQGIAEIVQVSRFGADALNLIFRAEGRVGERLVYRGEESDFELVNLGRAYAFDADGGLLRLASEASRIRLAHLFDPYLAISASQIEALPHQITAVYAEMLPRQPLRFLLADDPGAGKTIMAGLLIKKLMIRGDVERCLIVAPGGLVEQWQYYETGAPSLRRTCGLGRAACRCASRARANEPYLLPITSMPHRRFQSPATLVHDQCREGAHEKQSSPPLRSHCQA